MVATSVRVARVLRLANIDIPFFVEVRTMQVPQNPVARKDFDDFDFDESVSSFGDA